MRFGPKEIIISTVERVRTHNTKYTKPRHQQTTKIPNAIGWLWLRQKLPAKLQCDKAHSVLVLMLLLLMSRLLFQFNLAKCIAVSHMTNMCMCMCPYFTHYRFLSSSSMFFFVCHSSCWCCGWLVLLFRSSPFLAVQNVSSVFHFINWGIYIGHVG